jgi:CheY-like chemotaxis protein
METNGATLWLVAEDSEDDFCLLQRACSRLNPPPKIQRAQNGVEAQHYLSGDEPFNNRDVHPLPAMIVSDLDMPLMDGLDLLAWFKRQLWSQKIPFVLLTGSGDPSARERAREHGVDDFLVKPGGLSELVNTVAGISERFPVGHDRRSEIPALQSEARLTTPH